MCWKPARPECANSAYIEGASLVHYPDNIRQLATLAARQVDLSDRLVSDSGTASADFAAMGDHTSGWPAGIFDRDLPGSIR